MASFGMATSRREKDHYLRKIVELPVYGKSNRERWKDSVKKYRELRGLKEEDVTDGKKW